MLWKADGEASVKRIFVVHCEVGPGTCETFPSDAVGGFVECFVPSESDYEARELARACLEFDGYEVVEVDEPIEVTQEALHSAEIPEIQEIKQIIDDAVMSAQVMYGPFRVWTADDDDDEDEGDEDE